MTFSMIGRADNGGLASQTWEIARHVGPSKVLLVDLGANGRGPFVPERYDGLAEVRIARTPLDRGHLRWLCRDVGAVYTAEANYNDELADITARAGVRHVVHANPELWRASNGGRTTELVTPTSWECERLGRSIIMPMPVDRERLPYTPRSRVRRFYFPAAPAFHDRHGEQFVMEAMRRVRRDDITLVVGPKPRTRVKRLDGGVLVESVLARDDYWQYPDADALILPRRYGGLSLPMQEAASLGMPIISLDLAPYGPELMPELLVAAVHPHPVAMKGGSFPVWDCHPRALANVIEHLADDDDLAVRASKHSDEFADALAWPRWEQAWRTLLGA